MSQQAFCAISLLLLCLSSLDLCLAQDSLGGQVVFTPGARRRQAQLQECFTGAYERSGITTEAEAKIHSAAESCHKFMGANDAKGSEEQTDGGRASIRTINGKIVITEDFFPSLEEIKARIPVTAKCLKTLNPDLMAEAEVLFNQLMSC